MLLSGIVAHTYTKQNTFTDKFLPESIALITPQLFIFSFSLQRFHSNGLIDKSPDGNPHPCEEMEEVGGCCVETRRREVGF